MDLSQCVIKQLLLFLSTEQKTLDPAKLFTWNDAGMLFWKLGMGGKFYCSFLTNF